MAHARIVQEPVPEMVPLRRAIDRVDAQIVRLLAERFRLTGEVSKIKARKRLPPRDPAREALMKQVRQNAARKMGAAPERIDAVYATILSLSRKEHQTVAQRYARKKKH